MSNEEKNKVTAKLGYHKFTIKSHKSSEHIQQVSRDINQYLADIEKKSSKMSMEEMALLVALNIQSDNLDLQDQVADLAKENADLMVRLKSLEHTMGTLVKEIADSEKEKLKQTKDAKSENSSSQKQQKTVNKQKTVKDQGGQAAKEQEMIPEIQQPSLKSGVNTATRQLGRLRQTPRS